MLPVGFSISVHVSAYVKFDYNFSAFSKPAIFTSPSLTSPCLNDPRFQVLVLQVRKFY